MTDVMLSRSGSRMPGLCACCAAVPTTALPAQHSRGLFFGLGAVQTTVTVQVPYCKGCAAHAAAFHRASFAGLQMPCVVIAAITMFLALPASETELLGAVPLLMLFLGAPALAVGGFVAWRMSQRTTAAALMHGRHACGGPAVQVTQFNDVSVVVRCADPRFAQQLSDANRTVVFTGG